MAESMIFPAVHRTPFSAVPPLRQRSDDPALDLLSGPPQHMVTYSAAGDQPPGHLLLRHIAVGPFRPVRKTRSVRHEMRAVPFFRPAKSAHKASVRKIPERARPFIMIVAAPPIGRDAATTRLHSAVGGEAQVDSAVLRPQPAGGDDLATGVEVNALAAVHVSVAEQ
jgi:hypothetical protein